MKFCGGCQQEKPISEFGKSSRIKSGIASRCKDCTNSYLNGWTSQNKSKHNEYVNKWKKENKEEVLVYQAKSRKRQHYLKKYGLTKEDYDLMLEKQNGVCAICFKINKSGIRLSVDHDHNTGRIRGLLCHTCNLYLGRIEDNLEAVKRLEKYLNA